MLIEVLGKPLNGVIGRNSVVDELQKAMGEVPAASD